MSKGPARAPGQTDYAEIVYVSAGPREVAEYSVEQAAGNSPGGTTYSPSLLREYVYGDYVD